MKVRAFRHLFRVPIFLMKTRFAFGKQGIDVALPGSFACHVAHTRSAPALNDVDAALAGALDRPIGSEPLVKLAAGKRSAAISVCDITRPAPNAVTLPPLLKRLHAAGIPIEGVTILIATGLHRAGTPEELDIIVGPEIARKYRIVSHDARDLGAHRPLGTSSRGTPVFIDERFMAADLHITLGFVEQHLMLGFSGGRKLVVPGLAAQETIKVIHSPRFMREPMAIEGSIDGNPLHAELVEIAAMARHDFILDVTLTRERKISGVFAGNPVKAHAAAVHFLETTSTASVPALADAVITSAAGYPLDLTFYQSVKGLTAAQHIVKPGGRILVLGECAEGMGSPEFAHMIQNYPGHAAFLEQIRDARVEVDQWQLERLALLGEKHELFFYTPGISPAELGSLAPQAFSTLDQAIAALIKDLPPDALVVLIPEGPYTFARPAMVLA
jgi:nickel-dependent lactate racemase